MFVEEPNYTLEQSLFLNWINQVHEENGNQISRPMEMFTQEEKKFLFTEILCKSVTKANATPSMAKCFNHYFK